MKRVGIVGATNPTGPLLWAAALALTLTLFLAFLRSVLASGLPMDAVRPGDEEAAFANAKLRLSRPWSQSDADLYVVNVAPQGVVGYAPILDRTATVKSKIIQRVLLSDVDMQALEAAARFQPQQIRTQNSVLTADFDQAQKVKYDEYNANLSKKHVTINVSRGQTLHLARSAASMSISDPTIAGMRSLSDEAVFIFGKKPGLATLTVLDRAGGKIIDYDIAVTLADQ